MKRGLKVIASKTLLRKPLSSLDEKRIERKFAEKRGKRIILEDSMKRGLKAVLLDHTCIVNRFDLDEKRIESGFSKILLDTVCLRLDEKRIEKLEAKLKIN